jgi:prepilin-type N-terminal cleavage/methylation domain-containing protein/prepilin-type processing-associated H-X9-DG protein
MKIPNYFRRQLSSIRHEGGLPVGSGLRQTGRAGAISPKTAREAFTLIEMLVVIAIMALLASLLTPAVRSGLDRAAMTSCASNMRQIGAGMLQFATENQGKLPPGGARNVEGRWTKHVGPYLGGDPTERLDSGDYVNLKALRCPAHRGPVNSPVFGRLPMASYAVVGIGSGNAAQAYIHNEMNRCNPSWQRPRVFLSYSGGDSTVIPDMRPLAMIPKPAGTVMMTELASDYNTQHFGTMLTNIEFQLDPTSNGSQTNLGNANNSTLTLHKGKVNYLFADGHVSAYQVYDPLLIGDGNTYFPLGMWTLCPKD